MTKNSNGVSEGQNPNIDNATRARAFAFVKDQDTAPPVAKPATPKSKIVTKEQLANSGLSLRDYLNRERGLTRRAEPMPSAKPSAADSDRAAADAEMTRESNRAGENQLASGKVRASQAQLYRESNRAGENELASGRDKASQAQLYRESNRAGANEESKKRGGAIKKYASGGSIRGGGIEQRGKTKGRMV